MALLKALSVMICFWGTVTAMEPLTVGSCFHESTRRGWYNHRKLTRMIGQTWPNATEMDLSQNCLNLTHSKSLHEMQKFGRLAVLNLSGNYLPLLEKKHLSSLSTLKVLDLSRCHLAGIENGAFQGLTNLQTLLLGGNKLQEPLPTALKDLRTLSFLDLRGNGRIRNDPPDWIKGVQTVFWPGNPGFMPPRNKSGGHVQHFNIPRTFQRKLLSDINEDPTTTSMNRTNTSQENPSHSWQYLVAVLVTAISISIIIALGAKCKVFHRYLASYRHSRLPEGDNASHCDPMSLDVGFSGQDMMVRGPHTVMPPELDDDDDGFIEDNYIQACERERAERAAVGMKGEDEDDDDIQFTIG